MRNNVAKCCGFRTWLLLLQNISIYRAREKPHSIKYLLREHEGLNSEPQNSHKIRRCDVYTCSSSAREKKRCGLLWLVGEPVSPNP